MVRSFRGCGKKMCGKKPAKSFFFLSAVKCFSCMTDIFFCTEGGTQNTKKCPHPSPKQKQKERDRPQKCTSDWLQSSSNVQEDFEKKEMFLNFFLMESNELLLYPRKYRFQIFNWYFHFFPYYLLSAGWQWAERPVGYCWCCWHGFEYQSWKWISFV